MRSRGHGAGFRRTCEGTPSRALPWLLGFTGILCLPWRIDTSPAPPARHHGASPPVRTRHCPLVCLSLLSRGPRPLGVRLTLSSVAASTLMLGGFCKDPASREGHIPGTGMGVPTRLWGTRFHPHQTLRPRPPEVVQSQDVEGESWSLWAALGTRRRDSRDGGAGGGGAATSEGTGGCRR